MERNRRGEGSQTPEEHEALHINSIVIPADDEIPVRQHQLLAAGLQERQQLVGGHIESIYLRDPAARLYCNEEGKGLELPMNKRATLLLWAHSPAFRYRDTIVGDTLLVGPVGKYSIDTSAPDEYVERLFEARQFRVEVQVPGNRRWHDQGVRYDQWMTAYEHALRSGLGLDRKLR